MIRKTRGLSLIEVLISLLLISLILFGLDAAEFYSMKETQNAFYYSTALDQIDNATERLIALKTKDGFDEQFAIWNAFNQIVLPQGFGSITGHFPNYVVTVYWGNIPHHCEKTTIGSSGCLRKKIQLA